MHGTLKYTQDLVIAYNRKESEKVCIYVYYMCVCVCVYSHEAGTGWKK